MAEEITMLGSGPIMCIKLSTNQEQVTAKLEAFPTSYKDNKHRKKSNSIINLSEKIKFTNLHVMLGLEVLNHIVIIIPRIYLCSTLGN